MYEGRLRVRTRAPGERGSISVAPAESSGSRARRQRAGGAAAASVIPSESGGGALAQAIALAKTNPSQLLSSLATLGLSDQGQLLYLAALCFQKDAKSVAGAKFAKFGIGADFAAAIAQYYGVSRDDVIVKYPNNKAQVMFITWQNLRLAHQDLLPPLMLAPVAKSRQVKNVNKSQFELLVVAQKAIHRVRALLSKGAGNTLDGIYRGGEAVFRSDLAQNLIENTWSQIDSSRATEVVRYYANRAAAARGGNCQEHAYATAAFLNELLKVATQITVAKFEGLDHVISFLGDTSNSQMCIVADPWLPKGQAVLKSDFTFDGPLQVFTSFLSTGEKLITKSDTEALRLKPEFGGGPAYAYQRRPQSNDVTYLLAAKVWCNWWATQHDNIIDYRYQGKSFT